MQSSENVQERMTALLTARFAPLEMALTNDSAKHAGHAGAGQDTHYRVRITAAAFTGKSRVERHRMVYEALQGEIDRGLHALQIQAFAPGEGG